MSRRATGSRVRILLTGAAFVAVLLAAAPAIADVPGGLVGAVTGQVDDVIGQAGDAAGAVTGVVDQTTAAVQQAVDPVADDVASTLDPVTQVVDDTVDQVQTAVDEVQTAVDQVPTAVDQVPTAVDQTQGAVGQVQTAVDDAAGGPAAEGDAVLGSDDGAASGDRPSAIASGSSVGDDTPATPRPAAPTSDAPAVGSGSFPKEPLVRDRGAIPGPIEPALARVVRADPPPPTDPCESAPHLVCLGLLYGIGDLADTGARVLGILAMTGTSLALLTLLAAALGLVGAGALAGGRMRAAAAR